MRNSVSKVTASLVGALLLAAMSQAYAGGSHFSSSPGTGFASHQGWARGFHDADRFQAHSFGTGLSLRLNGAEILVGESPFFERRHFGGGYFTAPRFDGRFAGRGFMYHRFSDPWFHDRGFGKHHFRDPRFHDDRFFHHGFRDPRFGFKDPRFHDDRSFRRGFRDPRFDDPRFGPPRFEFRKRWNTWDHNRGGLRPWTYPLEPWTYPLR